MLKLELEATKKQLELQVTSHEVAQKALEDDRRIREEEADLQLSHSRRQLADLQESLNRSENGKSEAIKDYLLARHNALNRERQQAELTQTLQSKLDHALAQLRDTAVYYNAQSLEAERIAEEKTNDFTHCFRLQVVEGEETLQVVKEQYKQLQAIYSTKIHELESRLSSLGEKYRDLELRRNLEMQGYKRDVEQLRTVAKQKEEGEKEKTQKRAVEVKQCQRCLQKGTITQGKSISPR
jgi:coiled-coil domain-containing protein 77